MIRLTTFAGAHLAVFGLGGSGVVAAEALVAGGAQVSVWDDNPNSRQAAADRGLALIDLSAGDWSDFSGLVLAPGVPLTHPEPHWVVRRAQDAGVEIIGDIELFCRQRAHECPTSPFIAITGTNGKSTTTALAAHVLRTLGHDVQMGGNIGKAVLTLEPPAAHRIHVVEVSSYQIDLAPRLNPTVGVFLNLMPDHLDRHGTIENYAAVKERLVARAEAAVIGLDDAWTKACAGRLGNAGGVYPFSSGKGVAMVPRLYALGTTLFSHEQQGVVARSETIASLDGIDTLRGAHNVQNALAVLGSLRALQDRLDSYGGREPMQVWQPDRMTAAFASFPGLAHRLEVIGHIGRVLFVNDSKATNVGSADTALRAWDEGIYWIAGGQPKTGGIDDLSPHFAKIAKAYLIGEAQSSFGDVLEGHVDFALSGTIDAAVKQAAADALASPYAAPVVLLSPACASFDQFKNFEARGDAFRDAVAALPGVELRGRAA